MVPDGDRVKVEGREVCTSARDGHILAYKMKECTNSVKILQYT